MKKTTNIKLSCLYCVFMIVVSKCSGDKRYKNDNINKFIFDGRNFKFIDLTLSLNKQYARLSEDEKARVRLADGSPSLNYEYKEIEFCEKERIGTTIDLKHKYDPLLFSEHPDKNIYFSRPPHINSLPLESLIVPLIIADISSKVNGDRNFILKKHHLDYFLNNYFGNTAQPCIVVFKFGWSTHKHDIRRYYGLNHGPNETATPGISEEVAKWITTNYKNVIGVGVDLPSVDPGTEIYDAHNTLVGAGLYVVTNVDLEKYLPDAWCTALLLPQADQVARAPARFVAICPKSRMERHEIHFHRL